ncbi:MAG: hypothetical protein WBG11_12065 [Methylocella sp.]
MRILNPLIFLSNMAVSPAFAAAACDTLAQTFGATLGTTVERKSELFGNVFLHHPAASEFVIICGPGNKIGLSVALDGSPTADYLHLSAIAGSLMIAAKDADIEAKIALCLRVARKSDTKTSETHSAHIAIQCLSFAGDGGGNVVSLSPRD